MQIKGELLNAFNRHIFSSGNNNPNDPNFGLVHVDTPETGAVHYALELLIR